MSFSLRRAVAVSSVVSTLFFSGVCSMMAQNAAAVQSSARLSGAVNPGQTVRLTGHVPSWATAANDQGAVDPDKQLSNLHLTLTRAPGVEAAFQQLLADQQNPASPRFHQWLTPAQNAEQYGIAPADLQAVEAWLQSQGLSVDDVAAGGVFLTFSGKASAVNGAFGVSLHNFAQKGETHFAPTTEPAIPAALSSVVASVVGLAETMAHPHSRSRGAANMTQRAGDPHPSYTSATAGQYFVSPGDFKVIYDINAATNAGYTGAGYRVAIIIDSRVAATDISAYESLFGLQGTTVNQLLVSGQSDPGTPSSSGGELEADLDTQRVIGTAAGAGVDVLLIGSLSYANVASALQYELNTVNDAVVNMSFGSCDSDSGSASVITTLNGLYTSLAAQGVSIFASSGDTGAAGCDSDYSTIPTAQAQSANLICASGYITCVGGTEFNDTTNPSLYWSSTNSSTYVSALSYIPEGGWNDPSYVSSSTGKTVYQAASSGGGPTIVAKPSWQTGTGVPNDGYRDTPDVSFLASPENNAYMICEADLYGSCTSGHIALVGGTSASSPSMAAVATILDQRLGARQGNINPLLYQIAAGSNASSVFHDVTVASSGVSSCAVTTPSTCNNSTPTATSLTGGLSGFLLTAGYDEVTGLGSLDVNNFLTAAVAATGSSFTITPASTALYLNNISGATITTPITLASVNNFAGTVGLTCSVTGSTGTATGTCSLSPTSATLIAGGTATSTLTISNGTAAGKGTLSITVTGTSGTTVVTSSTITVNVVGATYTITPAYLAVSLGSSSAASVTDGLTLASINSFAGSVALACSVTSSGTAAGTCSVSSPVTLTAGGTASSSLVITSSAVGGSGTLTVLVTGTGGGVTTTSSITVTVTPPSFSITPAASSLSFTSGATTGNSTTLTLGSVSNYAGTINLTCSLTTSSAANQPGCSISPTSVTLTAGSTGTAMLTISSTTAHTAALGARTVSLGWSLGGGAALAFLLFCTPLGKRRRVLTTLTLSGLLALGLGTLSGCSSNSGGSVPTTQSSAGNYTVTITGTPAAGATTSAVVTTTIAVTIN